MRNIQGVALFTLFKNNLQKVLGHSFIKNKEINLPLEFNSSFNFLQSETFTKLFLAVSKLDNKTIYLLILDEKNYINSNFYFVGKLGLNTNSDLTTNFLNILDLYIDVTKYKISLDLLNKNTEQ